MNPSDLRCKELIFHEIERYKILEQCGRKSDVLYANFRYDEICFSFHKLREKGLNLKKLFKFQNLVHRVVYPWNTEYNTLRENVNRGFNVFPLVIVMAVKKKDVIAALAFARKYKLRISLRGGSHCYENFSIDGEIIIDQSHRKKFKLSEDLATVKVQPGVLLGPISDALYKKKRHLVIGSCPNNAVVGFTLGGGIGLFTRLNGVSSDNMVNATVLLADGRVVKANENKNQDLFWALRGAGNGNYGIILDIELKTHRINKIFYFTVKYPFNEIEAALALWTTWTQRVPITLLSDFFCNAGGSMPEIRGYFLGTRSELESLLTDPLSIKGAESSIEKMPYIEAVRRSAGIGRWLPFFKFKNAFTEAPFPPEALSIIKHFMSLDDHDSYFIIDSLGGFNDKIPPDATAFVHRGLPGWFHLNAQWSNQSLAPAKIAWVQSFYEALEPYLSKQVYQNTPDTSISDPLQRYYYTNLPRLIKIKREYDPENIFNYSQSIPLS